VPDRERYIWLFFRFDGRIGRAAYFLANMLIGLIQVYPLYRILLVPEGSAEAAGWGLILLLAALLTIWPYLALATKRLHDIGRPGILAIGLVIPLVNVVAFFALCLLPGEDRPNAYGRARDRRD
jgi:uncharacterized membrane protein YhaH (DUF805 family)